MEEFEFLRRITIGIYMPVDSPLHRLDPRAKIIAFLFLVIAATLEPTISAGVYLSLVAVSLVRFSHVPVGFALSGLKPAIPFLIIIAFLDLILAPSVASGSSCVLLWHWWLFSVNDCVIRLIALIFLRFITLILLTSLLTMTTSTAEMGRGLETLFSLLNKVGIPGYELALIFSLTFRFVPTFALEAERLVKSQIARGADFGEGGRWRFVRRAKAMLPLTIPFFLMALQRAETMALAMEARGFIGGKGRTRYRDLRFRYVDTLAMLGSFLLALLACVPIWPF